MPRNATNPSEEVRQVLSVWGELTMYAWKNVDVVIWDMTPSADGVRQMTRTLYGLLRDDRSKRTGVHVMRGPGQPPGPEARAEFARFGAAHARAVACLALVMEQRGFVGGALASSVTGMMLESGRSLNTRLFGSLREVAEWLPGPHLEKSGVTLEPAELATAFVTIERLHPRFPSTATTL